MGKAILLYNMNSELNITLYCLYPITRVEIALTFSPGTLLLKPEYKIGQILFE